MDQILTCEQESVLDDLKNGLHVVVRAGPGMGKSTLALHVALAFPHLSIMLVVYNRRLKEDTQRRCQLLRIGNLSIYTYHSLARKYFVADCQDNSGIRRAIEPCCSPLLPLQFDMLVMDEQQDMTPLYANLAIKTIKWNTTIRALQLLVLGDERQSIYDFNSADSRFLTLASRVFAPAELLRGWSHRTLTVTHRLTEQMANTVNELFLGGEKRFTSARKGSPVRLWVGDIFDTFALANEIERWVDQGYAFDEIMIVAPSVRTNNAISPVARLENRLVELGYPVTVTSSDNGPILPNVIAGKIVFASYHQTKGTERECVLVLSVDNGYFKYFNPNARRTECPNPIFVAITRAKCELTIVINRENGFMPFVNEEKARRICNGGWEIIDGASCFAREPKSSELREGRIWNVVDLVRHQPDELVDSLLRRLTWASVSQDRVLGKMPSTVKCENGLVEQISDLVAIAVPALHELRLKGRCGVMDSVLSEFECRAYQHHLSIIDEAFESGGKSTRLTDMLIVAAYYQSHRTGLIHRVSQLEPCSFQDWMPLHTATQLLSNMADLAHHTNGEHHDFVCEQALVRVIGNIHIVGRADLVDYSQKRLLEVKCVSQIQPEHQLELALYAFLMGKADYTYVLANIATGDHIEMVYNLDALYSIAVDLVNQKGLLVPPVKDEDFVKHVAEIWSHP